jgi:hypothetical protein
LSRLITVADKRVHQVLKNGLAMLGLDALT